MMKEEYPKEECVLNRTGEHHDAAAEDGKQGAEERDAPGHMGLISENHPGMTADIPACSPAPAAAAAAASSPLSRALLAAASASIPKPCAREGGRNGDSRAKARGARC